MPYQKMLHRIVKRRTGRSVYEQISLDVENVLTDIANCNFDGVSKIEINEIKSMLPTLIKIYPEEAKRAISKKQTNQVKIKQYKV